MTTLVSKTNGWAVGLSVASLPTISSALFQNGLTDAPLAKLAEKADEVLTVR